MVSPITKKKSRASSAIHQSQQSSTTPYLLLAAKIVLALIILFLLPKFVTGGEHGGRRKLSELRLRRFRSDCQNDSECALMIPEESLNCVNQCVSPTCYVQIYHEEPLEAGEIDFPRAQAFDACVKKQLRELRRQNLQQKLNSVIV